MKIKISGVESLTLNRIFYIAPRREKGSSKRPDQATVVFERRGARRAFSRFSVEITLCLKTKAPTPTFQPPSDDHPAIRPQSIRRQPPSSHNQFRSLQRQGISRYRPTTETTAGGRWRNCATRRNRRRPNTANDPHIRPATYGASIQTKSAAVYY